MDEHVREAENHRVASEDVLDRLLGRVQDGTPGALEELQAWEASSHNLNLRVKDGLRRARQRGASSM